MSFPRLKHIRFEQTEHGAGVRHGTKAEADAAEH